MGCLTTSSTLLLPSPSLSKGQATWSNVSPVTTSSVGALVNSLRTPSQSSSVVFVFPGSKGERDNKPHDSSLKAAIVGPTVAVAAFIILVTLATVHYRRKKRNNSANSLSSSGLIPEKHQQSVSFNPMLDDALYLLPSDMGIQNSEQRETASSRSISNPVYDRGSERPIKHKCEYAHPCKRIPPLWVENHGFAPEENVYSEAWVPGTPGGFMSDVSKEHLTSTLESEVPVTSDCKTPGSIYRDKSALYPPFYVSTEKSEPYKPPGVVNDENYENEMHDEMQSPASLYDVVGGVIFGGADEGIDGERLTSANPLYEDHTFVQESFDSVERRGNDNQEVYAPLYDTIEHHETADEVTERFHEAPLYDTSERPIYEPVWTEGPGHHANASITGSGAVCFSVDNTEGDSSRRSGENHESPGEYQELLQRGDAEPEVRYHTLTRPTPTLRKKTTQKNSHAS